ncbi:TetR/AcrR family transcriptional regulator [Monaibacterium marinum]|nr:TetR/AcrR family transcriptional regulator [Monaibacterium marinum]
MAWEIAFDADEVLESAAEVFSIKGYEATSISDLVKGMGINKGSIYNTFGGKRDLFHAVLAKFVGDQQADALKRLMVLEDPIAALMMPFDVVMSHTAMGQQAKGGLIITVAMDFPNHEDVAQQLVMKSFGGLQKFFATKIAEGQRSGAIAPDLDADAAAKSLTALMVGFRVLSRGAFDTDALKAVQSSALRLVGVSVPA